MGKIQSVLFIDSVHPILEDFLVQNGIACHHDYTSSHVEITHKLKAYDGLVVRSRIPVNKVLLENSSLQFIARSGAGLENIDLVFCKEKGIHVISSPEGNKDAVAEHCIGMLLMLFNKLKQGDAEARQGLWNREKNRGLELKGKTVGIIGYGHMGSAFAQRLNGFGVKVLAYDKYKKSYGDAFAEATSLENLQQQADVVSIHLPLSEETNYYVNTAFINKMAKPFYLINTARGMHVNITDLLAGMEQQKVLGACLDVLEYEKASFENISDLPQSFKTLAASHKVLLSPHVAGWTVESYLKLSSFLAEKIQLKFKL